MPTYGSMWPKYAKWWDEMEWEVPHRPKFDRLADFAIANKERYEKIARSTGVPWVLIAVLHRRESDANFNTYLGNGEPLNRVTRLVPRGRGPFASFEAGAIDALRLDNLDKVIDWRLEKMLYYCEVFNGWGYHNRGLPSPYVWGLSSIQRKGKYVADGEWNPNAMDTQPGCAPLIAAIARKDPSVRLVREEPIGVTEPPKTTVVRPTVPSPPPKKSLWETIVGFFRRK